MNRKLQYILLTSLPYGCKLLELTASATKKRKKSQNDKSLSQHKWRLLDLLPKNYTLEYAIPLYHTENLLGNIIHKISMQCYLLMNLKVIPSPSDPLFTHVKLDSNQRCK